MEQGISQSQDYPLILPWDRRSRRRSPIMFCQRFAMGTNQSNHRRRPPMAVALVLVTFSTALSQQYDPSLFSGLRWRLIGPFRAGRVTCVAGVPGQPSVYYFGTPGGGVWKTTNAGRTWRPIFDQVHVASIGA